MSNTFVRWSASWRSLIGLLAVACLIPAAAGAVDLHRLWEDRCGDCHGDAGDFARAFLSVTDGNLQGRHPDRDLRLFLQNHYLKHNEIDAVYSMLLAQASSQAQFKAKCGACHGQAATFVRESLLRRDGVLYGRESGRPLSEFLQRHRHLDESEIVFFVQLLNRIDSEVNRP